MDEPLLYRLAVALGVGLIVGVERGWRSRLEAGGRRPAGVRTFSLTGLLGGVLAAIGGQESYIVLAAGLLGIAAFAIVTYIFTARETHDLGMTTELSLVATFGLGALAGLGSPFEAAAAAIVMALVLGMKPEFHNAILGLERKELLATLQLLLIAVVLVPLLPSRPMGPWDAVNPRTVGMLVLLIAGFSYIGYFAVRVLGSRMGLMLTALFGGLSSSTAVTVAYARRAIAATSHQSLFGAGIALAAAMMVPRLSVEVSIVNPALLRQLWPTFAALALVPLIGVLWVVYRSKHVDMPHDVNLSNPLQLRTALVFGVTLSLLFITGRVVQQNLGDAGIYAMAAITGLVDVDAISLSLAEAARDGLEDSIAARGIVLAILVNTATKAVLAAVLGGAAMLRSATVILAAAMLAGAMTALLTLA